VGQILSAIVIGCAKSAAESWQWLQLLGDHKLRIN